MKPFFLFCLTAVVLTSCLQSLDKDLVSNPLDKNYPGDYVIVDEITFEDKNAFGTPQCYPIVKFHINPETADKLDALNLEDNDILLNVILKRSPADGHTTQNQPVLIVNLKFLEKGVIYEAKYNFWWLKGYDDVICPSFYLSTVSPFSTTFQPRFDTSKVQVLDCFTCGG